MSRYISLVKQDTLHLFLNPMWIFFSCLYPFLLTVILGMLNSGGYSGGVSAYDYYGLTMILYAALNTSMTAANSFMEERIKAGNMRILYAPVSTSAIYLSKVFAAFFFSFFWLLVTMFLMILVLDVNFGNYQQGIHQLIHVLLLLAGLQLFSSISGVMMCCLFRQESLANQVLSIVITAFTLLGGGFFRLSGFGATIMSIGQLSPYHWILAALYRIIYHQDLTGVFFIHVTIFFSSLFCLSLCRKWFRKEDYV